MSCIVKDGNYEITQLKRGFFRERKKIWRLRIEYEDVQNKEISFNKERLDVFLSLRAIPKKVRRSLNIKNIMWIDIENKERPLFWNDLGEEVALFLKRYGVRFFRVKE